MTHCTLPEGFEKLDACIHCGMCLPSCPTYRTTGSEAESPRGRLYLMRAFLEGTLKNGKLLDKHLDSCLGCLACTSACPSGVDYEHLLQTTRQARVSHQNPVKRLFRRWAYQHILAKPQSLATLAGGLKLYQGLGIQALLRNLGLFRVIPALSDLEAFTPEIPKGHPLTPGSIYGHNRKGRVALLTGCVMNTLYHRVHRATIQVLTANGYEVVIPQQSCCGALPNHSGEVDISISLAQETIAKTLATQPDWIITNAAGCGSTLKAYDQLLPDSEAAAQFVSKTVDVLELLAKTGLDGVLMPVPLTVTYHAACHLHHAQGVQQQPYALLAQIPMLKLVALQEASMCCGSAGVYNLAHPVQSMAILKEKMRALSRTQADTVLAANPGCMVQLETGIRRAQLDMTVAHPIEILAQAYPATGFSQ